MANRTVLLCVAAAALLSGATCPVEAQNLRLDDFLSQALRDADSLGATLAEWTDSHPGEHAQSPGDRLPGNGPVSDSEWSKGNLQGFWCLRSTTEIDLGEGLHVRRVALFYAPQVRPGDDMPLPPLPVEQGAPLREHECKLTKILTEFSGEADPASLTGLLAKRMPGARIDPSARAADGYWQPVWSFRSESDSQLFLHSPNSTEKKADPTRQPRLVLEQSTLSSHGRPSATADFDPLIGQPSLAIQAAKLARLPLAPTLDMLSFLMPQGGTGLEQPPFYCERELVPILRHWMKLAAAAPPEQHAAALLLADQVARRVSECAEFDEEPPNPAFPSDEARDTAQQVLLKDLHALGIETQHPAHMGYEFYAGNLLPLAHKLAPAGRAEELNGVAVLSQRCVWSAINDADCAEFIHQGEAFLKRYPNDEWTPSIHLVLAEAYSITLGQDQWSTEADTAADAAMTRAAIAHLGAWYAHNGSEQTRALVWQEIWDLQAGLGPWLMVPSELRR